MDNLAVRAAGLLGYGKPDGERPQVGGRVLADAQALEAARVLISDLGLRIETEARTATNDSGRGYHLEVRKRITSDWSDWRFISS